MGLAEHTLQLSQLSQGEVRSTPPRFRPPSDVISLAVAFDVKVPNLVFGEGRGGGCVRVFFVGGCDHVLMSSCV